MSEAVELTARELRILIAMADGLSNAEIADELKVARETVKFHAVNIYSKMGAKNRAHAVALAYHTGLLVVPRS